WTYACAMIPAGWLAEQFGARRLLALGLTVWALATMLVGVTSGFITLLVLRLLLGLGESVAFPSLSKLLADAVPAADLGTANGVIAFAYLIGPAVGTLLGGYLMSAYG